MTLKTRFFLVGLGIVIFTITTPIAALYALGYKFDWSTGEITKTGSLIVESQPRRADIFLNDQLQTRTTDANLRFILPGDYTVKIEKEGYQSWTKRLTVRPALVTWANQDRDYITLFYQTPVSESEQAVSLALPAADNRSAVVVQGTEVHAYHPDNASLEEIGQAGQIFSRPTAMTDDSALYHTLRYGPARLFTAEQVAGARALEANDAYAALLAGRTMLQAKDGTVTAFAENVAGFTLQDEHAWYVHGNRAMHANWNLGVVDELVTLPFEPTNAQVIRGGQYLFAIMDGTLYMINEQADEIYRGVTHAYWDGATSQLVFGNDHEALVLEPKSLRADLIIRSSSPIRQPTLNRQTGYLFFINENRIKAIELDGRDHRNVYTILDQPAESFLLSSDGKRLTAFTDTMMSVWEIRE